MRGAWQPVAGHAMPLPRGVRHGAHRAWDRPRLKEAHPEPCHTPSMRLLALPCADWLPGETQQFFVYHQMATGQLYQFKCNAPTMQATGQPIVACVQVRWRRMGGGVGGLRQGFFSPQGMAAGVVVCSPYQPGCCLTLVLAAACVCAAVAGSGQLSGRGVSDPHQPDGRDSQGGQHQHCVQPRGGHIGQPLTSHLAGW